LNVFTSKLRTNLTPWSCRWWWISV